MNAAVFLQELTSGAGTRGGRVDLRGAACPVLSCWVGLTSAGAGALVLEVLASEKAKQGPLDELFLLTLSQKVSATLPLGSSGQ